MWAIGVFELILVLVALVVAVTTAIPALLVWLGVKAASGRRDEPWLLGVCSAVAKRRNVPVFAVRLLTLLAIIVTGVVPGVIAYLVLGVFLDQWILAIPPAASLPPGSPPKSPIAPGATEPDHERIGRYRITGVIGQGGMGTVYHGRDDALLRDAAVKVLHPRFATDDGPAGSIVERFAEEARSIARLTSPHVVQIYEFEPQATPPYLAMEYVDGPSLQQILRGKPHLSPATTAECGRHVLIGLAAAHAAGIIHRDVKPANILRTRDGTYKLTDFGLARSFERAEHLTLTGTLLGTVSYLAPEVAGGEEATAASDLYSLGITLYEMLTGTTPFGDASPLKLLRKIAVDDLPPLHSLRDDIPEAFAAWMMKLLARDPADRFASATAALAALDAIHLTRPASDDIATLAAASRPVTHLHEQPRDAARWIPRRDVDSILRTALRLESEGESLVGERSVLEIARELNVDTAFVRKTLAAYQNLSADERLPGSSRRHRGHDGWSRRAIFIWLLLAAGLAVFLAIGLAFVGFKRSEAQADWRRREEARLETMQIALPMMPRATVNEPEPPPEPRIILLDSETSDGGSTASD